MTQPLRIEDPNRVSLITTRTRNSELWFVNNHALHNRMCGNLARFSNKYEIELYAFTIQGNHYHLVGAFPKANRADFMRDFNSSTQRSVKALVKSYLGGSLWARRYAEQALPLDGDIEDKFFYCALQSVNAGLCARISDYPGYNSFYDAITGNEREFEVTDWTAYHNARRHNPDVDRSQFTTIFKLVFKRLPGYESLTPEQYKRVMLEKLEQRRRKILELRAEQGKRGFPPLSALHNTAPGSRPQTTKTSGRKTFRPLVLSACASARSNFLSIYFRIVREYKAASEAFRGGDPLASFPLGTYKPPLCFNGV